MNHKVKIIFIAGVFLSFFNCSAEYLIFKKDKNLSILPISEKEHEFVYDILLKYQWPMSIANPDKKDLAKYSLAEAGPLEENFIRSKIQEKFKDIDIVFIPTFVYEAFVIAKIDFLLEVYSEVSNDSMINYLKQEGATISGVLYKFNKVNSSKEVRTSHFSINNLFLNFY